MGKNSSGKIAVAAVLMVCVIVASAFLYQVYVVQPHPSPSPYVVQPHPSPSRTPTPSNSPYPTPTGTPPTLTGSAKIRVTIYYNTPGLNPVSLEQSGPFEPYLPPLYILNQGHSVQKMLFEVLVTLHSSAPITDWQTTTRQTLEVYRQGETQPVFGSTGPANPIQTGQTWYTTTLCLSTLEISAANLDDLVANYQTTSWRLQCKVTVDLQAHVGGHFQLYRAITPAVSFPFTYLLTGPVLQFGTITWTSSAF